MAELDRSARAVPARSVFIPLLILIVTYLVWTVFQTVQLVKERDALATLRANQEKQVQDSKKLRESLDKLTRDMQALANGGNKGAKLVVDELRKRGFTISAESSGATSAAPAPQSGWPAQAPGAATKQK